MPTSKRANDMPKERTNPRSGKAQRLSGLTGSRAGGGGGYRRRIATLDPLPSPFGDGSGRYPGSAGVSANAILFAFSVESHVSVLRTSDATGPVFL
jgi:hypothetical protein